MRRARPPPTPLPLHSPAALRRSRTPRVPYNMVSRCNIGYQLTRGSFQGLDLIIVAGIGPIATDKLQPLDYNRSSMLEFSSSRTHKYAFSFTLPRSFPLRSSLPLLRAFLRRRDDVLRFTIWLCVTKRKTILQIAGDAPIPFGGLIVQRATDN